MDADLQKKPHHHGNLREALVLAGLQLLEEGGPDALTLRKCAALAGVSHAAPAHHFDGLHGLKWALAEEGFRRFRNYMVDAEVTGEQTPRGRMKSICRGYLHFARDNRALFQLIFGFDAKDVPVRPTRDVGSFGYEPLRRCCAPFIPDDVPREVIEAQVWSLIHGFTTLFLAGRFWALEDAPEDGAFDQVMALLDRVGTAPESLGNPGDPS
ncbi:TetR/AcrR family transcriptional regulator [Pseudoruegeria sp. HB172150]|uniref:TetR/AcrR family transcriptional regulator n=1 Tax=Pseudoruegeria sp. HB172150 TaxID=2721164 RepID=UPI001552CA5C|nr:TetR/AcrR family transcriptional regulator [Pseudoruegeria sp. HB172150]